MSIPALILASSSPRRRQLLAEAGYEFAVVSPTVDEPADLAAQTPTSLAEALAYFKARSVAQAHPETLVLGADTIVASADGKILGKPDNEEHARQMLSTLSGSRHAVISGVALLGGVSRRVIASETTFVTMRKMTDQELDDYIASNEWCGKAGAYAIQETADRFVINVEGSLTNVVGLPMELVERLLDQAGVLPARKDA